MRISFEDFRSAHTRPRPNGFTGTSVGSGRRGFCAVSYLLEGIRLAAFRHRLSPEQATHHGRTTQVRSAEFRRSFCGSKAGNSAALQSSRVNNRRGEHCGERKGARRLRGEPAFGGGHFPGWLPSAGRIELGSFICSILDRHAPKSGYRGSNAVRRKTRVISIRLTSREFGAVFGTVPLRGISSFARAAVKRAARPELEAGSYIRQLQLLTERLSCVERDLRNLGALLTKVISSSCPKQPADSPLASGTCHPPESAR